MRIPYQRDTQQFGVFSKFLVVKLKAANRLQRFLEIHDKCYNAQDQKKVILKLNLMVYHHNNYYINFRIQRRHSNSKAF